MGKVENICGKASEWSERSKTFAARRPNDGKGRKLLRQSVPTMGKVENICGRPSQWWGSSLRFTAGRPNRGEGSSICWIDVPRLGKSKYRLFYIRKFDFKSKNNEGCHINVFGILNSANH